MANSIVIPVRRGDTVEQPIVWEAPAGSPVDLTGSMVWMNIRIDAFDGVLTLTEGHGLTIADPTTGAIVISLSEQQTKWLYPGQKSTLELKRRIGGAKKTAVTGAFSVTESINPND